MVRNKSFSDQPYAEFEFGVTPNSSPKETKVLKSGYRFDPLSGLPVCVELSWPQWFFRQREERNGAKAEVVIWMEGSSLRSVLFCAAVGDSRTKARDGSKTGRISFGGTASGERGERDPIHDFPMTSHFNSRFRNRIRAVFESKPELVST